MTWFFVRMYFGCVFFFIFLNDALSLYIYFCRVTSKFLMTNVLLDCPSSAFCYFFGNRANALCWGRHCVFMMTSSNGNIFRVTGPLCGKFTGPGELPWQRPVTRSFDVFIDLRLNKRLSKQPAWCWWFEMPSRSFWRHCNVCFAFSIKILKSLSTFAGRTYPGFRLISTTWFHWKCRSVSLYTQIIHVKNYYRKNV